MLKRIGHPINNYRGFTLLELVIVLLIIGIVVAIWIRGPHSYFLNNQATKRILPPVSIAAVRVDNKPPDVPQQP